MPISLVVRPGVDSAFLAWRAPYINDCRGFALTRRVMRAPGSTPSPETVKTEDGFAIELVSSWVGFANGPKVPAAGVPDKRELSTSGMRLAVAGGYVKQWQVLIPSRSDFLFISVLLTRLFSVKRP
jgi:hypothetical protein